MMYIKTVDGQNGLFIGTPVRRGEVVLRLGTHPDTRLVDKRTRTSIQLEDTHIECPIGSFINHKDLPECNTLILGEDVIAIRDIGPDEEITFDYSTNEDDINSPFLDRDTNRWIGTKKKEKD